MQVHIATTAVVGSQVEDDLHTIYDALCYTWIEQVNLNEFNPTRVQVALDVGESTTAQVVHDAHLGPTLHQRINQVGADERSSTGNENLSINPVYVVLHVSN
jgi:hypothetical protein